MANLICLNNNYSLVDGSQPIQRLWNVEGDFIPLDGSDCPDRHDFHLLAAHVLPRSQISSVKSQKVAYVVLDFMEQQNTWLSLETL